MARNRVSSIINISGLAIGLTCMILGGKYAHDEPCFERSYKVTNRTCRVNIHEKEGDNEFVAALSPPPVLQTLQNNFPEIARYTRIFFPADHVMHGRTLAKRVRLNRDQTDLWVFRIARPGDLKN